MCRTRTGKQHLLFKTDIGPDDQRRFTDAHTALVFEYYAAMIDDGAVQFSLVLSLDGTNQWRNVSVLPVYLSTRNNDKSIINRPSSQRLLACIPVYDSKASRLSDAEMRYRRKEVIRHLFHMFPHDSTIFHIYILNLLSSAPTRLPGRTDTGYSRSIKENNLCH